MANGTPVGNPQRRGLPIGLWIVEAALVLFWAIVVISQTKKVEPIALWGIAVVVSVGILALAGHEINGQWFGILIDTRNKMSLARLQMTLWTVMVLTAFLTMALIRVRVMIGSDATLNQEQALDIKFPSELILAMGISAASFAGATLIKSNKTTKQVTIEVKNTPEAAADRRKQARREFDDAVTKLTGAIDKEIKLKQALDAATAAVVAAAAGAKPAAQALEADAKAKYDAASQEKDAAAKDRDVKKKALDGAEEDLKAITDAQGLLHKNADPSEARWVDLFRGEEIGNYKLVDMSKVQMLFFTVVVITTYAAGISSMLRDLEGLTHLAPLSFPDFSDTLNALLGISHGTYLSVKAVNHS